LVTPIRECLKVALPLMRYQYKIANLLEVVNSGKSDC
jgi:hypothetical protein